MVVFFRGFLSFFAAGFLALAGDFLAALGFFAFAGDLGFLGDFGFLGDLGFLATAVVVVVPAAALGAGDFLLGLAAALGFLAAGFFFSAAAALAILKLPLAPTPLTWSS